MRRGNWAWHAAMGTGETVVHDAAAHRAGPGGPCGAARVTPFEDLHSYVAIPRVTGLRLSPAGPAHPADPVGAGRGRPGVPARRLAAVRLQTAGPGGWIGRQERQRA